MIEDGFWILHHRLFAFQSVDNDDSVDGSSSSSSSGGGNPLFAAFSFNKLFFSFKLQPE
jgi:hypothetical protein